MITERTTEEVFQERLDELLLIEHKIDLRAQEFQEKSKDSLARLNELEKKICNDISMLREMNDTTHHRTRILAELNKKIIYGFIALIVITVLTVGGTYFWFGYIKWQIKIASLKLDVLDLKLNTTPKIIRYHGDDYVRIISHTESSFNDGNGEYTGDYAKVWHDKRLFKLKGK
jgi:hypothetical protein